MALWRQQMWPKDFSLFIHLSDSSNVLLDSRMKRFAFVVRGESDCDHMSILLLVKAASLDLGGNFLTSIKNHIKSWMNWLHSVRRETQTAVSRSVGVGTDSLPMQSKHLCPRGSVASLSYIKGVNGSIFKCPFVPVSYIVYSVCLIVATVLCCYDIWCLCP